MSKYKVKIILQKKSKFNISNFPYLVEVSDIHGKRMSYDVTSTYWGALWKARRLVKSLRRSEFIPLTVKEYEA
jgi:hypothetical protein